MKKRKIIIPSIALAVVAAFGLGACGATPAGPGGESQPGGDTSEVSLGEIVVTAAENKTELLVGETVQLTAKVNDQVLEGVTWKSRAEAVATVDANGLVTAVGAGQVKIRAEKDGYDMGSINITVNKAPEKEAHTIIDLEHADHYSPNDIWGMDLSAYGMGFMGPGESPVEDNGGATEDGHSLGWLQQGCKETLTFTSNKAIEVEIGISMAYNAEMNLASSLSVTFNGAAIDMTGKICEGPEDGDSNNYYDWHTTSFGKVNLVAGNNVLVIEMIGQGPNMDVFKVYSDDKDLVITVVEPVAKPKIEVTPAEAEIEEGETVQLVTATTGVTYTSSAEAVATVSNTGLVTGVSMGKATITLEKEGMKKATVAITVKAKPVAGQIVLEAEDAVLPEGTSIQLENGDNCSGGKSLGYFSAEQTFELKFNATEVKTYKLSMVMSSAVLKSDWSGFDVMTVTNEVMTVKFNDADIDLGTIELPDSSGWTKVWKEVEIGEVTTKVGENVFSFAAITQGPNIDCLKLTDPNSSVEPPVVNKYNVSFNANGGTGEMAAVEAEEGEYTLPACTFTAPEGMVFAGWEYKVTMTYGSYSWEQSQVGQVGDKITLGKDIELKATWIKENITISFNAGGGTGTMDPVTVKPGEYTLPECTFTAPGTKVFAGWSVTTQGQWGPQTQVKQAGEKVTLSDDIEITATWKVVITKSEQIDLTSAFVMEAEEATIAGAQTQQGGSPIENNESSSGGKDVGYMAAGASITFNFNASAAGKVKLILKGRSASADWSNWQNPTYYDHALEETTSIKVNDVDVNVTSKGFLGSDGKTTVQVDLGEVDVVAGPNTIVITALQQAPNFDCIALVSGSITFTLPTA